MPDDDLPSEQLQTGPEVHETPIDRWQVQSLNAANEAVQEGGAQITAIHNREAKAADNAAVLGQFNALHDWKDTNLYHPDTGILNKDLGKDAPPAVDKTLNDYNAQVGKLSDGLANDQQKQAFQRMAEADGHQTKQELYGFEHRQTTAYADQQTASFLSNSTSDAIKAAGKPDIVEGILAQQKAAIIDAGKAKNLSPTDPIIQRQLGQTASATNLGVMKQLIAQGQDQAASAWYDGHKDQLYGQDAETGAQMVKAGSLSGQAQRISDSMTVDDKGQITSRDDLLTKIQNDPRLQANTQLRDEVTSRATRFLDMKEQATAQQQKQAFTTGAQMVQDPGNPQGLFDPRVQALRTDMSPEQWEALSTYSAKRAKSEQPVTDRTKLYHYELEAANPLTQMAFAKRDLSLDINSFSPADFQRLTERQADIIKGIPRPGDTGVLSMEEAVQGIAKTQKVDPKSQAMDALRTELMKRVDQQQQATGKKATPEDIQRMGNQLAIDQVRVGGTLWNSGLKPVYALTPQERSKATLPVSDLKERNPAAAAQAVANLRIRARGLGLDPLKVSNDQYDRALAQATIWNDRKAAGDQAGMDSAKAMTESILREGQDQRLYGPAKAARTRP